MKDDPSLNRVDRVRAHVPQNAFHGQGTYDHASHHVFFFGKQLLEDVADERMADDARIQFMVFPGYGHAAVMEHGSEHDSHDAVREGARLLLLHTSLHPSLVQYAQYLQGVAGHRLHVYGAMVVQPYAADAHRVGIVLQRRYLRMLQQDVQQPHGEVAIRGTLACEVLHLLAQLGLYLLFLGGFRFHDSKLYHQLTHQFVLLTLLGTAVGVPVLLVVESEMGGEIGIAEGKGHPQGEAVPLGIGQLQQGTSHTALARRMVLHVVIACQVAYALHEALLLLEKLVVAKHRVQCVAVVEGILGIELVQELCLHKPPLPLERHTHVE